ncbi:MAG: HD domain-containing protein, partial [Planctomycetota bacterium]
MNQLKQDLKDATSKSLQASILFEYMKRHGESNYDEDVTQLEHALQAGELARRAGSDAVTTTAALLHDIGHFLTDEHAEGHDFREEDWLHEELGASFLGEFFHPLVSGASRLHVDAKRYLCAVDVEYHSKLSAASVNSLRIQGGPMSDDEVEAFRQNPHFETVAMIRRWDDEAK